MRLKSIILLGIFLFGVVFFKRVVIKDYVLGWQKPNLPSAVQYSDVIASDQREQSNPDNAPNVVLPKSDVQRDDKIASVAEFPRNDNTSIPLEYNLAVPFQSQAPLGNWDQPYQDACEEASLIMANAFFSRQGLSAKDMDAAILKLVDWEVKTFGYYEDTSAAEVVRTAKEYFGLKATLDFDVRAEHIKSLVSQNKLVIIPAAGKLLPNPNFKNGGPIYHMLVVRGYTADKFITNDPGTRLGKEFLYTYSSLINAIHDWPAAAKAMAGVPPNENGGYSGIINEADMLTGRKVIIVVSK